MAFMLERHDHAKPILRSVARELLSSCVLRSLMSFFNPYTANKVCPRTSHAPSRSDLRLLAARLALPLLSAGLHFHGRGCV